MLTVITSCTAIPSGLEPVDNFDSKRYLGKWYEIARLDHRFERDLTNVSATYSPRTPDGVTVVNKGYDTKKKKWKSIEGNALFIGDENVGSLKVSFFGPFYGGYHIIDLDKENYSYSMVVGPDRSYFWILSRARQMEASTFDRLVKKAAMMGIDTAELILVEQQLPEE
jgi:apolipoprotein D and lipocalin family protein